MSFLKSATGASLPSLAVIAALAGAGSAMAGEEPYIGDIMIVGFNFCPRNWVPAQGQLMAVAQNQALFALLGTTYGGDGRTTFALPDLQGRVTVGSNALAGPSRGAKGGQETVAMTSATMPAHTHRVLATEADGDQPGPGGKLLAGAPSGGTGNETIYSDQPPNKLMSDAMISNTGGGAAFSVLDPGLSLLHCIAVTGLFPPRS
ncbi:phage tail protein [Sinirhodobacter huangdaonensis]|uniref:Phage tail protein n=2 Tax=Paenirhodobacter huangdaonensis TaxID=2501515 RepID=A0A443LRE8_9RHOB|nr:tail fiber protein [Sinirhodobacter huangdaonensis]RWR51751.1 phage tail protein [Sinirhodobacter huangdaonensis]